MTPFKRKNQFRLQENRFLYLFRLIYKRVFWDVSWSSSMWSAVLIWMIYMKSWLSYRLMLMLMVEAQLINAGMMHLRQTSETSPGTNAHQHTSSSRVRQAWHLHQRSSFVSFLVVNDSSVGEGNRLNETDTPTVRFEDRKQRNSAAYESTQSSTAD